MRVTIEASSENELVVQGVVLKGQPMVEKWIKAIRTNADLLWPKNKNEKPK